MLFSPGTVIVHDRGCFWNLVLMKDGTDVQLYVQFSVTEVLEWEGLCRFFRASNT